MSALLSRPRPTPATGIAAARPASCAQAAPPPAPRPVAAPVRLTRRGRLVVHLGGLALLALAVVATVTAAVLLIDGTAAGAGRGQPVPVVHHVVAPGETLWQVAGRVAPQEDPRDVVLRIVTVNDLADANVAAGTRLVVPLTS